MVTSLVNGSVTRPLFLSDSINLRVRRSSCLYPPKLTHIHTGILHLTLESDIEQFTTIPTY